jgi:hypothetical protein
MRVACLKNVIFFNNNMCRKHEKTLYIDKTNSFLRIKCFYQSKSRPKSTQDGFVI